MSNSNFDFEVKRRRRRYSCCKWI